MKRGLVVLGVVFASVCAAHGATTTITATQSQLDLGTISNTLNGDPILLGIESDGDWALPVALEADERQPLDATQLRERIEVRALTSPWTALSANTPAVVCGGGSAITSVTVFIRVVSQIDSLPGERHLRLRFGLGDAGVVRLSYSVQAVTALETDPRAFDSPRIDPGRPGTYPFDVHRYVVRSNVPWRVELSIGTPKANGVNALPSQSLVVVAADGSTKPLLPEQQYVVAAGQPTGTDGEVVEVRLAVRVGEDGLASGDYNAPISVTALSNDTAESASWVTARKHSGK